MDHLLDESTSVDDIEKMNNAKKQKCDAKGIEMHFPYDILRMIFQYLGAMDLASASIVCSTWLKAAKDEAQRRGPVCIPEDNVLDTTNDESDSSDMEYNRDEILRNLRIKPKVAIFLDSFYNQGCPSHILPIDCHCITLTLYPPEFGDDTCTSSDSSCYDYDALYGWIMYEDESFGEPRSFGAFLPDIPGVEIDTFYILDNLNNFDESMEEFQYNIGQAIDKPDSQGKMSKCVLLLSTIYQHNNVSNFIASVNKTLFIMSRSKEVCLWGGDTYEILLHNAHHGKKGHLCGRRAQCVAIVMTGAFDCWTMIMDETHKTQGKIEMKLMELKKKVHLKRHSMGFMFAACKPGKNMGTINEFKIKWFNEIFPGMPLLDCIGKGMFGFDTIGDTPESKADDCWSNSSTVFLIITYG